MRRTIAKHGSTIIVAVIAASLTAAAPSVAAGVRAAFARNSDRVDGIHAKTFVQARGKLANRRGVLVATDKRTGMLPTAVIPAIPGSKIAVASLPRVPMAVNATNATSAATATSATTAASAANADRLGGLTHDQLTRTKVATIPSTATLATEPTTTVTFTAPAAGYVTWNATCQFVSIAGVKVQVNLRTLYDRGGNGVDYTANHFVDIPTDAIHHQALSVNDWVKVDAGETIAVGVQATAASSAVDITCASGRLIATYSATTTEG